jgi:hypothetical protein
MSLPTPATISCPRCKRACTAVIWNTVNVTVDPALRQRVMDSSINTVTCANCKQKINVDTDLLYHDMDHTFLIWLVQPDRPVPFSLPDSFLKSMSQWQSHRLRFVSSHHQLVEKIKIFEAGLNDFLIEAMKFVLWSQSVPEKCITDDSMYFCALDNQSSAHARLLFELYEHGKFLGSMGLPFEMYAAGLSGREGSPNYRLGEWIIVNQSNIGSF